MVALLLFGGVLADRFSRTAVMQVSNLTAAASQAAIAALVLTDRDELWLLIVLFAINGAGDAAGFPAMAAMVPALVPRQDLQNANVLLSFSRGGMQTLGPTIGAVLVVTAGPGWALAACALAWVASALLLLLGARPDLAPLIVAALLAGAGAEVFHIGWTLAMQENIDEDKLCRAYSYDALGSYVAIPVGQLTYGPLGDSYGNRDVLVVSGIVYAAISLLTLASRSVRALPRRDLGDGPRRSASAAG